MFEQGKGVEKSVKGEVFEQGEGVEKKEVR